MERRIKKGRLISLIALILAGALFSSADAWHFDQNLSVNSPLSPNTNAVATFRSDSGNTTFVAFQFGGRIPVWTPTVSSASKTAVLGSDVTFMIVTFKKGLTVEQTESNGNCMITLNGTIEDSGYHYNHVGTNLGSFPCKH